ncbi:hypothetical protein ABZT51_44100 [Streptomyces sp. NPDC005373]|uniref:hypothetical protein n=1 Tax=Streptomyces sp. NPDC005373 TaxID=3156879 RepID=UPI0033A2A5E5
MDLHISACALLAIGIVAVIGVSALVGLWVYRWTQERTPLGIPQKRGDLVKAIGTAAATSAALATLIGIPASTATGDESHRPATPSASSCALHPSGSATHGPPGRWPPAQVR